MDSPLGIGLPTRLLGEPVVCNSQVPQLPWMSSSKCVGARIHFLSLLIWFQQNWFIKMFSLLFGDIHFSYFFFSFTFEGLESNWLCWTCEVGKNHRICIRIFCGLKVATTTNIFPPPGSTVQWNESHSVRSGFERAPAPPPIPLPQLFLRDRTQVFVLAQSGFAQQASAPPTLLQYIAKWCFPAWRTDIPYQWLPSKSQDRKFLMFFFFRGNSKL